MVGNIATANITAAGASVSRTMAAHLSDTVSIADFGAVGDYNGTTGTDNAAAIQAAITAAMPSTTSTGVQRRLFIPEGNYKITVPLNLQGVSGSVIFGCGKGSSIITYTGSGTQGNTMGTTAAGPLDAGFVTPVMVMQGVRDTRFQDFSIAGTTANRTSGSSTTAGFLLLSPAATLSPVGVTITQNTWQNVGVSNFATEGAILGQGSNAENMTFINCDFDQCDHAAILASNANSLNHVVIGGKVSNCGSKGTYTNPFGGPGKNGLAGGFMGNIGTFLFVVGVDFENNYVDFAACQSNSSIIGCMHRGGAQSVAAIVSTGGNIFASGCTYVGASNKDFIHNGGGNVHATSNLVSPPSNVGAGSLFWQNGGGSILDSWVVSSVASAAGSNINLGGFAATLVVRNCDFNGSPFPPSTGTFVVPITEVVSRRVTVAELPTASATWKGVRAVVEDYNAAVTFAATVIGHGGGSTTVPVFCSGSDWLIGG